MSKIKKCKLSWTPSETTLNADDLYVEYRLYWAKVPPISYNSKFIELGNVTEVDLPDILEPLELPEKSIYLGISAVDKWGNESDIVTLSDPYKLSAPAAPADLALTPLNYYKITVPREKPENHGEDIQKQDTEKTDPEIQSNGRLSPSKFITTQGRIVDFLEAELPEEL